MRGALIALTVAILAAGCGVAAPDLFLLTRTGQGRTLTLLVNDSGTIRCDGGAARALADPLLLRARDLTTKLNDDATRGVRIPVPANSAFRYTIKLQNGTISFPDRAARSNPDLAQAELFAVQAAQQVCGLPG